MHKTFQALAQNQCELLDLAVVREWKRRKGSFFGGGRLLKRDVSLQLLNDW